MMLERKVRRTSGMPAYRPNHNGHGCASRYNAASHTGKIEVFISASLPHTGMRFMA